MNPRSVDEVIVRVESQTFTEGGGLQYAARTESAQFHQSTSSQVVRNSSPLWRCAVVESKETRAWEEASDAIWEEFASPDSAQQAAGASNATPAISSRRTGTHLSLEGVPGEMASSGEPALSHRDSEPRHRSLDLDIHLNEPNLVMLQDNLTSKPLSEHLVHRDFSFRPKRPDADSQQSPPKVVRVASTMPRSSAKPPSSPLQLRSSTPVERVQEEDEEQAALAPTSEAPSALKKSDIKLATPEVKLQLPDVHVNPVKTKHEDGARQSMEGPRQSTDEARRSIASRTGSPAKFSKQQSLRTVTLSKELLKMKTKSRLVESSSPVMSIAGISTRFSSTKKSAPQSPTRPSAHRAEVDVEEEDPFKDIDVQDKFRQGNLKAITLGQWMAFFVVMGGLVCSLTWDRLKGKQIWGLELWKWFLLVLVVLCGRLVSGWFIRILVIIFEKNFLLRKKVLYFVYGLRKGVQNCLWLGLVLLAWKLMFDPRVERSKVNHKALVLMTKLLECFAIGAFIWLVKLLLVKSLASSFHVATFFDRIQESLYDQHVLETLSGPPLLDLSFEAAQRPSLTLSSGMGPIKNPQTDPVISIEDIQKMNAQNVSAGVMKRLMNLVKHPGLGTLVTTIDESVGAEEDTDDIEINSELQAKAAAKLIFKNVAQRDPRSIVREDLLRFIQADEIPRVLCLFEGAKDTGKITRKALKNWVVNVYQERKALAHSLNDTKTAVKELHTMATVVVIVIIIVVWLLVLGIATTHVLLFITSQLLLVGFMFSNTVKQIFEAIIFLFVMHPFDVGDRCIIDGAQLIVEEMKILSTVFLRPDNEKVFYPNSVLATKAISNLYRSPEMREFLDFSVHISTPTDKINAFKERLQLYVDQKTEHWGVKFTLIVKELEDLNRMGLALSLQHTINFQNYGERLIRRSELLLEIKRIFADLGVEYRLLPQTIELAYPSTMQSLPPLTSLPPLYPTPH